MRSDPTDWASLHDGHLAAITRHYAQAAERAGGADLLIDAGHAAPYFRDDQSAPFHANAYFRHWLPVDECANCCLYVRPGRKPVLYFLQPRDYWHAAPADPEGFWVDAFDIRIVANEEALLRAVAADMRPGAIYLGDQPTRFANVATAASNPPATCDYLDFHRARKTAYEQACLASATERAVRGHRAAERAYEGGGSEFDVLMAFLAASEQTDVETPYGSIVAQNEHAAVLHYQRRDRSSPGRRRSLLIDAGAQHNGYAADITRSFAAAAGPFRDLVAALDREQQALIASIRPGESFVALHAAAHGAVGRVLADAGLIATTAEHAVECGITRAFLPHGLGHLLGLHVHDSGGHLAGDDGARRPPPAADPALRNTRQIEVDQVFTIEPGLYFVPMLLDALRAGPHAGLVRFDEVDALRDCGGIRIEDNVVVTDNGARNLTREAFAVRA